MSEVMFREEKRQFTANHHYEPFGVELEPFGNDTTDNKYRFTGHERDYHTNFDYMHFRFYASSMGRFLKPDNLIGNIANPQSWNLYSYVNGNPVNFNDPSGHWSNVGPDSTYMMNTSGASWIDWGAYTNFYSGLYGGNVTSGPGSGAMMWVTTTYSSTLNTYIEGKFQSSFDISYSASYIVDLSTGEVVPGSWGYNGDVSISEGANNPASAHYLASPENIETMEKCADTILRYSQSSFEAAVFLNIGMRETYMGVKEPLNPMKLSCSSGKCPSNDLEKNVENAQNLFREKYGRTGELLKALIAYNGNTVISHGKQIKDWYGSDVYRGYLEFLENMKQASNYGVAWRLLW